MRAATIDEIKETALRLMHSTGTTDLKFADIARAMGLTAPALYRYFADSDALLTELIVDAFDDLGAAVAAARDGAGDNDLWGRLLAVAQRGRLAPPLITDVDDAFVAGLVEAHGDDNLMPEAGRGLGPDDPSVQAAQAPATFQAMLTLWASLHGLTSLEAHGHLDWLNPAARDALFVSGVRTAALAAGLPGPPDGS